MGNMPVVTCTCTTGTFTTFVLQVLWERLVFRALQVRKGTEHCLHMPQHGE